MFPKNQSDVEYPDNAKHSGTRKDGRNLVQEWFERTKDKVSPPHFLWCFSALSFIFPIRFKYQGVQSDDSVNSHTFLYDAEGPLCLEQEPALVTESCQRGSLVG